MEMRITFVSCIGHMTYEHNIKKPMPIGEINLNQILSRNKNLKISLKRNLCHPILRKCSNIHLNNCTLQTSSYHFYKMNIRTNLLEEYVNFVDSARKQIAYFKTKNVLFVVIVSVLF